MVLVVCGMMRGRCGLFEKVRKVSRNQRRGKEGLKRTTEVGSCGE